MVRLEICQSVRYYIIYTAVCASGSCLRGCAGKCWCIAAATAAQAAKVAVPTEKIGIRRRTCLGPQTRDLYYYYYSYIIYIYNVYVPKIRVHNENATVRYIIYIIICFIIVRGNSPSVCSLLFIL